VQTTDEKSDPNYVAPEDRVATFDQDDTLWVEHPMYTQMVFCLDRVPAVVKAKAGARESRAIQNRSADCAVNQIVTPKR
jgi:hypothetical protein